MTLCDYRNLSVSVESAAVTDSERDLKVMESYSRFATLENSGITDRAAADGPLPYRRKSGHGHTAAAPLPYGYSPVP